MEELTGMKCVACRRGAPKVTDAEIAEYHPQVSEWDLIERDEINRLERLFQFDGFAQALAFTNRVGELAEEGRAPSRALDRVGKSNCHMVDAQNPRAASQRLHHGGKNGCIIRGMRVEK